MINTDDRKVAKYFVGTEVEHTPMFGAKTLFVVGVQPVEEILEKCNTDLYRGIPMKGLAEKAEHVYLGTSQSFNPENVDDWELWHSMIDALLDQGLWVTLDFDVKYAEGVAEAGWSESDKFIPMISVKLPYIRQLNYNATLKLDDTTWGHSNPGVWCHRLHDLQSVEKFTGWHEYKGDRKI